MKAILKKNLACYTYKTKCRSVQLDVFAKFKYDLMVMSALPARI